MPLPAPLHPHTAPAPAIALDADAAERLRRLRAEATAANTARAQHVKRLGGSSPIDLIPSMATVPIGVETSCRFKTLMIDPG